LLWYAKAFGTYAYMQHYHILPSLQSIEHIIAENLSLSRFGDGEFRIMRGGDMPFQRYDPRLSQRLREVLTTPLAHHVVGIPIHLKSRHYHKEHRVFWLPFTVEYFQLFKQCLSTKRRYVDTQLSRFYLEHKDKSHCAEQLALLKRIWQDRDVVIVEGALSCTGVGNDLYDNARSVKRIVGLAVDAFDKYDEMLRAITEHVQKDHLILLSYGMTATVLAYDLARLGYRAIDIGHLDIEYEWFRRGAQSVVAIEGKYTSEAVGGNNVKPCNDEKYLQQIICKI